ncbi:unnamed protein product [Owenia fusiformis]|uniref:Uncharacterized protein n=1 Tax=Owenia fusiformis TaxID=6347 RepID=A0A8S4PXD3_OWEFU|nr:unnamed protein product [Owenia fusiformis]
MKHKGMVLIYGLAVSMTCVSVIHYWWKLTLTQTVVYLQKKVDNRQHILYTQWVNHDTRWSNPKWSPDIQRSPYTESPDKCQPVKHFVFIKGKKCGGSTITNVFLRYGETHDLTFILPKPRTSLITKEDMERHIGDDIDVIVHHAKYDEKLMERLMPKDTVYIGVIREPLNHLKSYYNYRNFGNILSKPTLAKFEENPWDYMEELGDEVKNFQSAWFGWDENKTLDEDIIRKFVEDIEKRFDLILITDHMKESLVLLKDVLCWSLDDLLFVSHKIANESMAIRKSIRKSGAHESSYLDHTPNTTLAVKNLRQLSSLDYSMFDHFNHTLWENIKSKGDAFRYDLKQFDDKLRVIQRKCKYTEESQTLNDDYIRKVADESSSSRDYRCHRMLFPPNWYSHYILHPKQENKTNKTIT